MHSLTDQEKSCGYWSIIVFRQWRCRSAFDGVEGSAASSDICPEQWLFRHVRPWEAIGLAFRLVIIVDPFDGIVLFRNSEVVDLVPEFGREVKKREDTLSLISQRSWCGGFNG